MTSYEALNKFGCKKLAEAINSVLLVDIDSTAIVTILNPETALMEEQLRLEFLPLTRKERYGPEWQVVHCVIFIRKTPLKFDVSDESEKRNSYHLLETSSEDELIDWLRDQMDAYES